MTQPEGPWNLLCGCCSCTESEFSTDVSHDPTSGRVVSSEDDNTVSRKMSSGEAKQFLTDLKRVSSNAMPSTPWISQRSWPVSLSHRDSLAPPQLFSREPTSQKRSMFSIDASISFEESMADLQRALTLQHSNAQEQSTADAQLPTISVTKPDEELFTDTVPVEKVTPRRVITPDTLHQDSDDETESHT